MTKKEVEDEDKQEEEVDENKNSLIANNGKDQKKFLIKTQIISDRLNGRKSEKMRKERERMMAERQRGATGNGELNHFQLWERLWVSCAYPGQWSCWRVSRESLLLKSS